MPDRRSHVAFLVDDVDEVTWCRRRAASGGKQAQRGHDDCGGIVAVLRLHDERATGDQQLLKPTSASLIELADARC